LRPVGWMPLKMRTGRPVYDATCTAIRSTALFA
jgi:hypothetical protein